MYRSQNLLGTRSRSTCVVCQEQFSVRADEWNHALGTNTFFRINLSLVRFPSGMWNEYRALERLYLLSTPTEQSFHVSYARLFSRDSVAIFDSLFLCTGTPLDRTGVQYPYCYFSSLIKPYSSSHCDPESLFYAHTSLDCNAAAINIFVISRRRFYGI